MKREVAIEEISDGKLYSINDMVKADCQDCKGCSACCEGMGQSIVLDPLDIWNLKTHLHLSFQELMKEHIELNVVDKMILPNLKMNKVSQKCNFLDEKGRCSIHAFRPGICRIFPLGRIYEKRSFQYFLQVHECKKTNRSKIKVSKWMDCKQVKENQKFIADWHYFLKDIEGLMNTDTDTEQIRQLSMYLLNEFYVKDLNKSEEFYIQMQEQMMKIRRGLGI